MENLIKTIVIGLVNDKDSIKIVADEPDERGVITYHLTVAPDDMGRVIGKQGRIAKAVRTLIKAYAIKQNVRVNLEID